MCSYQITNRRSRQAIYMGQRPGYAQFEFTDDRVYRGYVYNATQQQILVDCVKSRSIIVFFSFFYVGVGGYFSLEQVYLSNNFPYTFTL